MTVPASPSTRLGAWWDGDGRIGRTLGKIDDAGDRWSDALRGRAWADLGASVLSNLSDHGAVWVLTAAWQARRPGWGRRRAVIALATAGVASYGVNRAVKAVAARSRPDPAEERREVLPVRTPTSSSFPSGHTLASFCTAAVLPVSRTARHRALVFAVAVAASRVHLRAHHTSDVLAGAVIGAALGTVLRPVVGALAPGGERRRRGAE